MTTQEASKLLGKLADINLDGMIFQVEVQDVRTCFGRTDALVVSLSDIHENRVWVALDRLMFDYPVKGGE